MKMIDILCELFWDALLAIIILSIFNFINRYARISFKNLCIDPLHVSITGEDSGLPKFDTSRFFPRASFKFCIDYGNAIWNNGNLIPTNYKHCSIND